MKVKVMALVFMVVFAAVATSIVINLSSGQVAEENADFARSYSVVQIDGEGGSEPEGKALDGPGMPG